MIEADSVSTVDSEGVKVIINDNDLYPSEESIEKLVPHRQETFIELAPQKTTCSESVKSLPISDRGCVFSTEVVMQFFPRYSFDNCAVECRMKKTIEICECMPYNFYSSLNTLEMCNVTKIECIQKNFALLHGLSGDNDTGITCNCPDDCDDKKYFLRMGSAPILPDLKLNIDQF